MTSAAGPEPMRGLSPRRVGLLLATIMLVLAAVLAKTLYLQVLETRALSRAAEGQQQNSQTLPAVRGDIVDRNGQPLAVGEERRTFYATPSLVDDPAAAAVRIGEALKMKQRDVEKLAARLNDQSTGFVYVQRKVPKDLALEVEKLKITGVGSFEEEQRIYPQNAVAGQVLGYAGVDNQGLSGIEMMFEQSLAGRPGKQVVVTDPGGRPIDVLRIQPEIDGRNVELTLDATIQTYAERVLEDTVKRFGAKGATSIVMNPRNGEVLAMVNVPRVDANKFGASPRSWQRNRVVTDTFEPGSTFKIVTVAGALEDGVVTPTTSFWLPPWLQVADRKIKESHPRPAMRMSTSEIIIESSNVGTIRIGQALGRERIDHWIRAFGFGKPTGIDFPGEVSGLLLEPEQWSGSTIGNVPIGQGVGVTAVQLVSSYAAIANDGVLVEPHLLRRVDGEPAPRPERRRVVSTKTARAVRTMLGKVVTDERGTGAFARIDGYTVAGKTGTANKAERGVYVKGKYSASFIGFVPAKNPQLLTLVVVDEPTTPWGGVVAAPAFERITQFALQYFAIPPDGVVGAAAGL